MLSCTYNFMYYNIHQRNGEIKRFAAVTVTLESYNGKGPIILLVMKSESYTKNVI